MKENMYDNSLIIITSDHGQLLGEHGRIGHGTFLYDELLKIPLFIKYPRNREIKIIHNKSKHISLIKLKKFILDLIENKISTDDTLYSDTAIAESFGIFMPYEKNFDDEKENIEKLEKYRVAVYYRDFKGIFNVSEGKFEQIASYNPDIKHSYEVEEYLKKKNYKSY